jgi:hypothetical protein
MRKSLTAQESDCIADSKLGELVQALIEHLQMYLIESCEMIISGKTRLLSIQ